MARTGKTSGNRRKVRMVSAGSSTGPNPMARSASVAVPRPLGTNNISRRQVARASAARQMPNASMSRGGFLKTAGLGAAGIAAGAVGFGGVAHANGGLPEKITVQPPHGSYNGYTLQQVVDDPNVTVILFAPGTYTLGEITIMTDKLLAAQNPKNKPTLNACFNVTMGHSVEFEDLIINSTREEELSPTAFPAGKGTIHNTGSAYLRLSGVEIYASGRRVHGLFNEDYTYMGGFPICNASPKITGSIIVEDCSIVCGTVDTVAIKNSCLTDVDLTISRNYLQAVFGFDNVTGLPTANGFYSGVMIVEHNDINVNGKYYGATTPGFSMGIWLASFTRDAVGLVKSNNIHMGEDLGFNSLGMTFGSFGPVYNVVAKNNNFSGYGSRGFVIGEFTAPGPVEDCVFIGNTIPSTYGVPYYLASTAKNNVVIGKSAGIVNLGSDNIITGLTNMSLDPSVGQEIHIAFSRLKCAMNGGTWDEDSQTCQ